MSKKVKATKEQANAANAMHESLKTEIQPFPPAEDGNEESEEPEPAPEHAPDPASASATAAPSHLKFGRLSAEVDKYRTGFFRFDADGVSILCKFVRLWAPGEKEGLEHAAIEVETYPDGDPYLLPANTQLWEIFQQLSEAGGADIYGTGDVVPLDRMVFSITRVKAVKNPKNPEGPPKFVRFSVRPAMIP